MAKNSGYLCSVCGWRALKWVGRCGQCHAWDTMALAEADSGGVGKRTRPRVIDGPGLARRITEVRSDAVQHRATGIGELDRVLGGGIVPGAAILFSGEPGVGKSTLLIDMAARVASQGATVLYSSGEESTGQVRLRAERMNALESSLYLAAETDLATVLGQIDATKPELVIVDSVQTLASDAVEGLAGGPAQVREVAASLIRVAKDRGVPVILVGHVTKDGSVAGPRVLEHLVDVVCHFEGDRQTTLRFLRTLKNRFGPTDEVGCFEMTGEGIREVTDPSGLFVSDVNEALSGVCTTITLEGRRALLAEVQALVTPSSAPNPRRVTSGVDAARVAMILAVLEKRCGVSFGDYDVFVSTVGGVKIQEPAADLAMALAILSSLRDVPLQRNLVAFGEISLAGEVRPVRGGQQRRTEAQRLGLGHMLDAEVRTVECAAMTVFNRGAQKRHIQPQGVE